MRPSLHEPVRLRVSFVARVRAICGLGRISSSVEGYDSNETADTERNTVLAFRLWHASLRSAGRTNASVPTRVGTP